LSKAPFHTFIYVLGAVALCCACAFGSDDDAALVATPAQMMSSYKSKVSPFVTTYCGRCHTGLRQRGGVTFSSALKDPASRSFRLLWKRASDQIRTHDMPPEDAKQPSDEERKAVVEWIGQMKVLSPKDPGLFVIRRLNKAEYGNTLHDLFGVDPQITHDLPDEVFGAGYTNTVSPLLMEQYLAVANDVMNQVFAPPGAPPTAVEQRLLAPGAGAQGKEAVRRIARSLARQAFRRPPTDGEVDLLVRVFDLAGERGASYPDSLRLMFKAVLVSPQFLFITPGADAADQASESSATSQIVALDDYQLASRLSYFLWATMPDAELSALADAGKLHEPEVLAAQARRMMKDPRSRALFDGFGAQWLGLDKLAGKSFDEAMFPQMDDEMRSAMYDEARLFFQSIVRDNRSIAAFIDSDYTFVNDTLAPIYGIDKISGHQMREVKLADANRGGILTMPGILAMSSFPNRTSAVNRGLWVLEQVLGENVPPPPPNVPALDRQDKQQIATMTLRQRTELHRADPVCANCHKILDPIGFGLENFDAIGRWRDKDSSGGAIDATGELPGGKHFSTPRELKAIIAGRTNEFCHTLTGKMLAYALCRQLEGYDDVVVDELTEKTAKDDYRMQSLVVGVVTSYPFTHRRVGNTVETHRAK